MCTRIGERIRIKVPRRRVSYAVFLVLLGCFGFLLAGCGGTGSASGKSGSSTGRSSGGTLNVFAAASLTDAFGELEKTFEKQNPGVKVRATFAGSSTVLAQIQQGAPADVFASADEAKMKKAEKSALISGKPKVFVKNREVIVVPKDNPAGIKNLRQLSRPGTKLVLAEDGVPAAEYAKDILKNANSEYGSGFEKKVLSNVVSRESDVRAAVNRVAVGDADATFGYASDVTPDIKNKVRVVEIPENLNVTATYPIAVLKNSNNKDLARKWVRLVTSKKGQSVLAKWGFEPVR